MGGDTDMQSDHFQGRIVHVHINFVSIEKNRIAVIYFSVFFLHYVSSISDVDFLITVL